MTGKIGMRFVALFCVAAISLGGLGCNDDSAAGNGDAGTNDNINSQGDGGTDPVAYPTVDTGQDNCFGTADCFDCPAEVAALFGQDSQYRTHQPSYVDNGDGTVSDLVTGLMWQQDPGAKMGFDAAVAGAASFNLAGHADWRLPTIKELYSLILFSGTDASGCDTEQSCDLVPFMDPVFVFSYGDTSTERLIDSQYVSATSYVGLTMGGDDTVFGVNFADGRIKGYPKMMQGADKLFFVLYVRGASDYGVNDFVDNGDATVSDRATGLMWMQGDSGHLSAGTYGDGALDWESSLAFCEGLSHAGYDDWRLPDAKELQSLVDYTRSPSTSGSPALDPIFEVTSIVDEGGGPNYPFYWTSTTHRVHADAPTIGGGAVYVAFGEALGWMQGPGGGSYELMDVHGAGAQRSDPKTGNPADYPYGNGPQGDVIRIFNHVRCVRSGEVTLDVTGTAAECPTGDGGTNTTGPTTCTVQSDCEAAGACPPDATLGCTCEVVPEGSLCIPNCATNADCPTPPDMTLVCGPNGLCQPE